MKKIISYSLWGDSRLYNQGMIENVKLLPDIYPDWEIWIYISEDCPAIPILSKMNCKLIKMPSYKGIDRTKSDWQWFFEHNGMFWRYLAIEELEQNDYIIIRDADSRLSKREANVVNHWLTTSYIACRIVENKTHLNSFMMTGMSGFKGGVLTGIKDSIEQWIEYYKTLNHPWIFVDLEYNNNVLAPAIAQHTIGYGYNQPFPLPELKEGEYPVGWVMNESWREEIFDPEKWKKENGWTEN